MYQPYGQHSRQCERCLNLIERTRKRCTAFPDGIPPELWNDEIEHTNMYPGDGGIRFEENTLSSMRKRRSAERRR
ncbi:MAG: hypothetical protein ACKOAX_07005 [Candidatus Kapaibacterium sp.]